MSVSLSDSALCTLADLKAYAGLSGDTYNDELTNLINAVSAAADAYTGRKLKARAYGVDESSPESAWVFDGDGSNLWICPERPLNSVSSLVVDITTITERSSVWTSGYVYDVEMGTIELAGYIFNDGLKNCTVKGNAGYSTVPDDLEQAIIEWAAWKLKESSISNIGKNLFGKTQKQLPAGGGTLRYWTDGLIKDIPPQIKSTLNHYRKVIMA